MTYRNRFTLPCLALLACGISVPALPLQVGDVPQDLVVADFDGNGRKDLAVVCAFSDNLVILLQDDGGNFTISQDLAAGNPGFAPFNAPRAVEAIDFDRNGVPGLVVLSSGNFAVSAPPSLRVYKNRGDGFLVPLEPITFQNPDPGIEQFPTHFVVGNFGGPVGEDLAVAMVRSHTVRIFHGDGTGGYTPAGDFTVQLGEAGPEFLLPLPDANGTSLLAATAEGVALLPANTPGDFGTAQTITIPHADVKARALLLVDYNGDGNPDLLVADANNRVHVLRNFRASSPWYDQADLLTDPSL